MLAIVELYLKKRVGLLVYNESRCGNRIFF